MIRPFYLLGLGLISSSLALADEPIVRRIESPGLVGSAAVIVDARAPLVHTSQILPIDRDGKPLGDDAKSQTNAALDRLSEVLQAAGSKLGYLARLNISVRDNAAVDGVKTALAERFARGSDPTMSFVVGMLARPNVLVAIDGVAASATDDYLGVKRARVPGQPADSTYTVLPPGVRIYISGQADPGADLGAATKNTLTGLEATLQHLGLSKSSIVQLKAFCKPMSEAATVEREVAKFFGRELAPPLVLVEWKMAQPIEIELIAAGKPNQSAETIEFLATPTLKVSPVFSRVAQVNRGDLIYYSGLHGSENTSGSAQVEAIFNQLKALSQTAGSDLRHLVKATYYVSDEPASKALNDLRPRYYDAKRPPAASKAMINGIGEKGQTVSVDMIGVIPPK